MTEIRLRVKPRSSRQAILGIKSGIWQVALTSPPEGGKANKELLKLLGKTLGVAPSTLELVRGHKSREKGVRVPDLSEDEIRERLTNADQ